MYFIQLANSDPLSSNAQPLNTDLRWFSLCNLINLTLKGWVLNNNSLTGNVMADSSSGLGAPQSHST